MKKALENLEGVSEAFPSHEKNEAKVVMTVEVSNEALTEAVKEAGYEVIDIL